VFNDANVTRARVPRTNSRAQITRVLADILCQAPKGLLHARLDSIRIAAAFIRCCDPVSWRSSDCAGRIIAAR